MAVLGVDNFEAGNRDARFVGRFFDAGLGPDEHRHDQLLLHRLGDGLENIGLDGMDDRGRHRRQRATEIENGLIVIDSLRHDRRSLAIVGRRVVRWNRLNTQ